MFVTNKKVARQSSNCPVCGVICGISYLYLVDKTGCNAKEANRWLPYFCPPFSFLTSTICNWITKKIYARYLLRNISKYGSCMESYVEKVAGRQTIEGMHKNYLQSKQFDADKNLIEFYQSLLDASIRKFRQYFGEEDTDAPN